MPARKFEKSAEAKRRQRITAEDSDHRIAEVIGEAYHLVNGLFGGLAQYTENHWAPFSRGQLEYDISTTLQTASPHRVSSIAARILQKTPHVSSPRLNAIPRNVIPFRDRAYNALTGSYIDYDPSWYNDHTLAVDAPSHLVSPRAPSEIFDAQRLSEADRTALQRFFGYCLLPTVEYKKALLLYGPTNSGKSTFLRLISRAVGTHRTCSVGISRMADPRGCAPLFGAGLNMVTEADFTGRAARDGFKLVVSGGDPMTIDQKYRAQFTYIPTAKHVFSSNSRPCFGNDLPLRLRMVIVPFAHSIRSDKGDNGLEAALFAPELIAWAVLGAGDLLATGKLELFDPVVPLPFAGLSDYAKKCTAQGFTPHLSEKSPNRAYGHYRLDKDTVWTDCVTVVNG